MGHSAREDKHLGMSIKNFLLNMTLFCNHFSHILIIQRHRSGSLKVKQIILRNHFSNMSGVDHCGTTMQSELRVKGRKVGTHSCTSVP